MRSRRTGLLCVLVLLVALPGCCGSRCCPEPPCAPDVPPPYSPVPLSRFELRNGRAGRRIKEAKIRAFRADGSAAFVGLPDRWLASAGHAGRGAAAPCPSVASDSGWHAWPESMTANTGQWGNVANHGAGGPLSASKSGDMCRFYESLPTMEPLQVSHVRLSVTIEDDLAGGGNPKTFATCIPAGTVSGGSPCSGFTTPCVISSQWLREVSVALMPSGSGEALAISGHYDGSASGSFSWQCTIP